MNLGERPWSHIASAPFHIAHYRALLGMFRYYRNPIDGLVRYLLGKGSYPVEFPIRTPQGWFSPTLYSYYDFLTLNEVFCREDYQCGDRARVVVDFGSNIGLSALYFLTRNPDCYCYLYEPLPQNVDRLHKTLAAFEGRYELFQTAVGLENGTVSFGCEPSGRYGGIGLSLNGHIEVDCRRATDIVAEVLAEHGHIDVLKIDIEGMEAIVLESLPADTMNRIGRIFVEHGYSESPSPHHSLRRYGGISRLESLLGSVR